MRASRAIGFVTLLAGCSTLAPRRPPDPPRPGREFSHVRLDRVLERFVDDQGKVDYPALTAAPAELEAYYAEVVARSPDSDPDGFPTEDARLAYWINAYNAGVLVAIVRRYPLASVRDVFPPLLGFFVLQRLRLGGQSISLRALETEVVRHRFADPRVHFALNCGSRGCPRLPRHAFTATNLQTELDREARRFVGEERNVHVDLERRVVTLSSIFDWYADDFTSWIRRHRPDLAATVRSYIRIHADDGVGRRLDACPACRVEFAPYDWRLNDQVVEVVR